MEKGFILTELVGVQIEMMEEIIGLEFQVNCIIIQHGDHSSMIAVII